MFPSNEQAEKREVPTSTQVQFSPKIGVSNKQTIISRLRKHLTYLSRTTLVTDSVATFGSRIKRVFNKLQDVLIIDDIQYAPKQRVSKTDFAHLSNCS